jgi:hypothetical protein
MTESELRTLVREAIAKHVTSRGPLPASGGAAMADAVAQVLSPLRHASHSMFVLPVGVDADGPCLIEPAVTCNHCGYCKSFGH